MIFKRRPKIKYTDVAPDEIFLDSKNLPNFNTQQFEGRIERPIPKRSILFLGSFFSLIIFIFLFQLGSLQIIKGEAYFQRSESNTLDHEPIFADRGMILDRKEVELAWNTWDKDNTERLNAPERTYTSMGGFAHVLGYVSYPRKDASGNYWQDYFIGKDGIEKIYDTELKGVNGVRITEMDVRGNIQSGNIVTPPKHGENIVLSIDAGVQNKMYDSIANMAKNASFAGGGGVIMDIHNGEILALTSYPEYNPTILSKGVDKEIINNYLTDNRKVFLNRVLGGVYTPGSIVKPFIGYGALVEEVITPFKVILSNGKLEIPNPYFPDKPSVFNDHGVFGYVDMSEAIAVSSDVYFYQIGGGYKDQKGLGILNIDKYSKMFGISDKTGIELSGEKGGVIPTPEWKEKNFKGDIWRVGDTYNTSIGQYGYQVTPIQMVRAVGGLATFGTFQTPHLRLADKKKQDMKEEIYIDVDKMKVIHEGMREAVTEGTAMALLIPDVEVAAKSGTAQVGLSKNATNSWIIGFFPYQNPRYAFAVMMERGPKEASGNSTRVMREVIEYMKVYTPEYLQ